jgi:CubicO group peptidase (beta-lactamase class C family)
MLLGHRSGLTQSETSFDIYFSLLGYSYSWLGEYLEPNGSIYDPHIWTNDPPDKTFHYANVGFELLGYIIELVTNQSYEKYCGDHIFSTLNMTQTSFHFSDFPLDKLAKPYVWIAGRYFPLPDHDVRCTAAGGLRTNVLDLAHFLIAQMNNGTYNGQRLLANQSIEQMHTVYSHHILKLRDVDYGLGWSIWNSWNKEKYEGHTGSVYGGQALMKYRVSDKKGVILFWNQFQLIDKIPRPLERLSCLCIEKLMFKKSNEF